MLGGQGVTLLISNALDEWPRTVSLAIAQNAICAGEPGRPVNESLENAADGAAEIT